MYYARKSNPKQTDFSLTGQKELCIQLIEQEGFNNKGGRADEARTGRTMFRRPGLAELIQFVRDGEVKVLVAETVDRFARNTADLHRLFETLCECKAVMITVQEGLIDEMRLTLLALKAAQDVRQTQDRVRRGQSEVLRDGRIVGSITYGQRKVKIDGGPNGLRELDPITAPIVKSILEDFAAGVSAYKICKRLKDANIKAPRGGDWRPAVLLGSKDYGSGILRNRMYVGEFVFRRTHRELIASTGKTITKPGRKADQVVLQFPDLRIVSDEVFDKIQARLQEGRRKANHPSAKAKDAVQEHAGAQGGDQDSKQPLGVHRRAVYVFTSKMTCGLCGQKMVVLGKRVGCDGRANIGNDCTNNVRVPRPEIEAAVFQGIREHLLQPELLAPYLAEYAKAEAALQAARGDEAARLKAQVAEAEKSIDNLLGVAAKAKPGTHGAARLAAEVDRMEQERLGYEQALTTAMRKRPAAPTRPEDVIAGMETLLDKLGPAMEGDGPEATQTRELVRELIDEIIITPLPTSGKQRRGSEPVQLVVTGRIDSLFEISATTRGRVTLSGLGTETCQAHASRPYRFEVVLKRQLAYFSQTADDSAVIERLLNEAEVPLTNAVLTAALLDGAHPDPEARRALEKRVRNVMYLLQKAGRVRSLRLGKPVGWVWTHRPLTDDEWRERAGLSTSPAHAITTMRPRANSSITLN
jgi:site-specific DNA recombinase